MSYPAANVVLLVAASHQQSRCEAVLKSLRAAGANSARIAARPELPGKDANRILAGMVKQGTLKDAGGGRYWIDEEQIARAKAGAGKVAMIVIAFLVSAAASLVALLVR